MSNLSLDYMALLFTVIRLENIAVGFWDWVKTERNKHEGLIIKVILGA